MVASMILTTIGSEYWPHTFEVGSCASFSPAFAVFGYVTATIATYFIGRDAEEKEGEIAGAHSSSHCEKRSGNSRNSCKRIARKPGI